MKKIDRLWETKKLVTVNTPDLNEQEAYIEQIEREKALSDDNLKAYVKMANDRQLRICNLEREKEEAVKQAFIFGYEKGHNDTVESGYGYIEDKANDYWEELKEKRG